MQKAKQKAGTGKVVRCRWYYRPDGETAACPRRFPRPASLSLGAAEVEGGRKPWMGKHELFKGKFHTDDISIETIIRRMHVRFAVRILQRHWPTVQPE